MKRNEPMFLPETVAEIIQALEHAGFAAYVVGGCVRDACLGLTPHDYDICTSALPEQTESVFRRRKLVLAGKKHGTVGVVTEEGVVEIASRMEYAVLNIIVSMVLDSYGQSQAADIYRTKAKEHMES